MTRSKTISPIISKRAQLIFFLLAKIACIFFERLPNICEVRKGFDILNDFCLRWMRRILYLLQVLVNFWFPKAQPKKKKDSRNNLEQEINDKSFAGIPLHVPD